MADAPQKEITLFQLPNSRAIRIAWLLEELQLPYTVVAGGRLPDFNADPDFKAQCGGLGKSPTIHDGDIVVQESGAIVEYLCETYSTSSSEPLIPPMSSMAARTKVHEFMHLAEGTFLLHAYPAMITRRLPQNLLASKDVHDLRVIATRKVYDDLDWLERHLGETQTAFLVGHDLSAADIMMGFSAQLIMDRVVTGELDEGKDRKYPCIEKWLRGLMGRKALGMAMKKTGFTGEIMARETRDEQ